jgi:hypothetical protein
MGMRCSRRVIPAGLSAAALAVSIVGGSIASSQEPAEYYVDRARPSAQDGVVYTDDQIDEVCTSYSPERPKVMVCGELPTDFALGKPPGVYPEVCAIAEQQYAAEKALWAADLLPARLGVLYAEVDPASCWVIPTAYASGADDAAYYVTFDPVVNGLETVSVRVTAREV